MSNKPIRDMSEQEKLGLFQALRNSVAAYSEIPEESLWSVIDYCEYRDMDPFSVPVFAVPMWDKKSRREKHVIMPSVNSHLIAAARSGCAGISAPEFGQAITKTYKKTYKDGGGKEVNVTYPAYCTITVKRILSNGMIAEFSATEFWEECVSTDKDGVPNPMWEKRCYGQLAKCAMASALRRAFPEIASAYTAEEMEGKDIYDNAPINAGEYVEDKPKAEGPKRLKKDKQAKEEKAEAPAEAPSEAPAGNAVPEDIWQKMDALIPTEVADNMEEFMAAHNFEGKTLREIPGITVEKLRDIVRLAREWQPE